MTKEDLQELVKKNLRENPNPTIDTETGVLAFTGRGECFALRGKQDGDWLLVEKIVSYGEASGTMHDYLIETILPQSMGYLHAVLVWEGGDSVTRLEVRDGAVSEEEVEL